MRACGVVIEADEDFATLIDEVPALLEEFIFLLLRESASKSGGDVIAFLIESEGIKGAFWDDEVIVFDVMSFEGFCFACFEICASIFNDSTWALRVDTPDAIFEDEVIFRVVEAEFFVLRQNE